MFNTRLPKAGWTATLPLLLSLAACASDVVDGQTEDDGPITGNTGGTTGEGTGGAATATGGSATGGEVNEGPVEPLPATVTDLFAPSGFMGKEGTKNEVDGITMTPDICPSRPEGAAGLCYSVVYQPQELDEASTSAWAGVFFQNPDGNWGAEPGVRIEAGATKVVFTAWSKTGSPTVSFMAGGVGGVGDEHQDTFKIETEFTLSTTPTEYELDLSTSTYDEVIGGFGWVAQVSSLDPLEFYVDDVRWVK